MYCPKCRVEYVETAERCSDCGAELVAELPPAPEVEYAERVTVYTAINENLATLAAMLLDHAGIECYTQEQSGSDVFGAVSAGFPVEVQVKPEDEESARKLLTDFETTPVAVCTVLDAESAEVITTMLDEAGIKTFTEPSDEELDEEEASEAEEGYPVDILVMPADVDKALDLLGDEEDFDDDDDEVDFDEVDEEDEEDEAK